MTQALSTPPTPGALSTMLAGADDDFISMRKKDFILPRANILQALSPDVVEGKFSAGTVMDSSTKSEIIKPRTAGKFIVPFMMWMEWIEWNRVRNVDKDQRIIARSVDPTSELAKRADKWEVYVNDQGREVCTVTEYYNFVCAIIDPARNNYEDVYLTGFARSSHRVGKQWLNRMFKTKIEVEGNWIKAPMFAMRWAYQTELIKKDGFSFYAPCIGDGQENPRSDWAQLKATSDEFKARRQEIMERNSNKEEHTDEAPAAGGGTPVEM
jgi:hypothetical protein